MLDTHTYTITHTHTQIHSINTNMQTLSLIQLNTSLVRTHISQTQTIGYCWQQELQYPPHSHKHNTHRHTTPSLLSFSRYPCCSHCAIINVRRFLINYCKVSQSNHRAQIINFPHAAYMMPYRSYLYIGDANANTPPPTHNWWPARAYPSIMCTIQNICTITELSFIPKSHFWVLYSLLSLDIQIYVDLIIHHN